MLFETYDYISAFIMTHGKQIGQIKLVRKRKGVRPSWLGEEGTEQCQVLKRRAAERKQIGEEMSFGAVFCSFGGFLVCFFVLLVCFNVKQETLKELCPSVQSGWR